MLRQRKNGHSSRPRGDGSHHRPARGWTGARCRVAFAAASLLAGTAVLAFGLVRGGTGLLFFALAFYALAAGCILGKRLKDIRVFGMVEMHFVVVALVSLAAVQLYLNRQHTRWTNVMDYAPEATASAPRSRRGNAASSTESSVPAPAPAGDATARQPALPFARGIAKPRASATHSAPPAAAGSGLPTEGVGRPGLPKAAVRRLPARAVRAAPGPRPIPSVRTYYPLPAMSLELREIVLPTTAAEATLAAPATPTAP